MKKLEVLLDMDGVLADFETGVEVIALEQHGLDLQANRGSDYIQDAFPEYREQILAIPDSPAFFAELPVVDGAIEAVEQIRDLGYVPRICSALFATNHGCELEKRQWLRKHLVPAIGKCIETDAIFTDRKADHDGIALIDDKARIRNAASARWQHIIFRRAYNKTVQTPWAIDNWHDEQLPELLARAAHQYRATS